MCQISISCTDSDSRYVNNDYRGFKQTLHDALHPGDDAPPVPHPSTWFPTDPTDKAAGSRSRRLGNSTDNMNNASDEDDDVIIASATTNLKCPLTLQMFVEPYSNTVCKHTFEKAAIIAYHHDNAVAFAQPGQRRGHRAPEGPKQVKCPQLGCEAVSIIVGSVIPRYLIIPHRCLSSATFTMIN